MSHCSFVPDVLTGSVGIIKNPLSYFPETLWSGAPPTTLGPQGHPGQGLSGIVHFTSYSTHTLTLSYHTNTLSVPLTCTVHTFTLISSSTPTLFVSLGER
jgi:hypothetical protein